MVTFKLAFKEEEMIAFFKKYGFTVTQVTWTKYIPVYHNRIIEEPVTAMCLINPHDNKTVPVSIAFEKVLYSVKNAILLDNIQKLTVLHALKWIKND